MSFIRKLLGKDAPNEQPTGAGEQPEGTVLGLVPGDPEPTEAATPSSASGPGVLRSQDGGKDWAEPSPGSSGYGDWEYNYGDTGTHEGQGNDEGLLRSDATTDTQAGHGDNANFGTPVDIFGQVVLGPQGSPAPAQDDAFYVDETGFIEATLEPTADAGQVVLENSLVTSFSLSSGGDEPRQGPAGDAVGIGTNEKWMDGDSGTSNASDGPGAGPGDVAAPSDAAGYDFPGDYAQRFDGIREAGAESAGEPDVIAAAGGGTQPLTVGGSDAPTVGGMQTESMDVARGASGEPPGDLVTTEPDVGPAEGPEGSISFNFEEITPTHPADDASQPSQEPVEDLLDDDESPLLVTLEEGTRPMSTMATGDVIVESSDTVDLDDDAEPEL